MRRYSQLVLHDPANGVYGDCFRASLASILSIDPRNVPHFLEGGPESKWYKECNAWLERYDLFFMAYDIRGDAGRGYREFYEQSRLCVYHIISGASPRFPDELHSVVGLNGKVIHDPHPERRGVLDHQEYGFLVKRCDL